MSILQAIGTSIISGAVGGVVTNAVIQVINNEDAEQHGTWVRLLVVFVSLCVVCIVICFRRDKIRARRKRMMKRLRRLMRRRRLGKMGKGKSGLPKTTVVKPSATVAATKLTPKVAAAALPVVVKK